MGCFNFRFSLRTTASCLLSVALVPAALAQLAPSAPRLPDVTVKSSGAVAGLPVQRSVQRERAALERVPGGTNLAEPQKEARLATLRDALDYQPGIVLQDFLAAPTNRA